ncbi:MAG: hypothetical protein EB090_01175 [Verrucomicrobia bacterium]|nr:hypothetical protein [Verrucomicrobiota bacterium]
MKPVITTREIRLIGVGAGLLLFVSAVNWWGISHFNDISDKAQQLTERKGKTGVAELLSRTGGVAEGKKDLKQVEELSALVSKRADTILGPWQKASIEAAGLGKDWANDPNKWKDLLVKYTDEVLKKSGKGGDKKRVILPSGFYLGLEDYKQRSPREEQVPSLAVQLSVSKKLVELLFQAKEDSREGYPTSCTLLSLKGPSAETGEGEGDLKTKEKTTNKKNSSRGRYVLEFESSPEVFYNFVHAVTRDDYFLVPVSMVVENEKLSFPKRSELASQFASSATNSTPSPEIEKGGRLSANPPLLLVLAGKERVRVQMILDYIQWKSSSLEKPVKKDGKP